jgi:hypothetical protein
VPAVPAEVPEPGPHLVTGLTSRPRPGTGHSEGH